MAALAGGCRGNPREAALVPLTIQVLAENGSVPPAAFVAVVPVPGATLVAVRPEWHDEPEVVSPLGDARFRVELPVGAYRELTVAAVDHVETILPVYFDRAVDEASVEVRLAANSRPDQYDDVRITGSWCEYDWSRAESMTLRPDDTYIWSGEVGADSGEVEYQLIGVTDNGHSVNGTQSEAFRYDGGGDFRSMVSAVDGRVSIVFDPAVAPARHDPTAPSATWDTDHADLDEVASLRWRKAAFEVALMDAARRRSEAEERGEAPDDEMASAAVRLSETLLAAVRETGHPVTRRLAALYLFMAPAPRVELADDDRHAVLELLPPSSPLWVLAPLGPFAVGPQDLSGGLEGYYQRLVDESPAAYTRGQALGALASIALRRGDEARWRGLYEKLAADYAEVAGLESVIADLDPDQPIQAGRPVPAFEVALLDGTTLRDTDLHGRWVLLHFWATWCGPCRSEMPLVHQAWAQYHDRGLEIVSLSLDRDLDDLTRYRGGTWRMPWRHALLAAGTDAPVARAFRVGGIPDLVLVGPDGRIAAAGGETRGEWLLATLEAQLGDGTGAGP